MDITDDRGPPEQHRKNLVKLIEDLGRRHDRWQVFSDFVEMSAISFSNAVDHSHREKREARYMEIAKRYSADELQQFPKMLGELTLALEGGPDDVLGKVFHDLELHNKYTGQFFTPYSLARMMAKITVGDDTKKIIADRGYVTAAEPACGAGAMVIALADEMKDQGINYQNALHVTAVDIDPKCVHMAYVQFALLHIPAVVVHGNSLSLEEISHWYTPAHALGGWSARIKRDGLPEEPEKRPMTHVERLEKSRAEAKQLSLL